MHAPSLPGRLRFRLLFRWLMLGAGLMTPALCPVRAQFSPVVDARARVAGSLAGSLVSTAGEKSSDGLRVLIIETGQITMTDTDGRFHFSAVRPGTCTLRISGEGFSQLEITDVVISPGGHRLLAPQEMPIVLRNGEVQTLAKIVVSSRRLDGVSEAAERLETFTVTGSHLKRLGAQAFPASVLDREALTRRNAIVPSLLLATVPEVSGLPLNESSLAGTAARGDHTAITMRGLGSGNTLILLNGRRLVAHPIAPLDERGVPSLTVNVNQLPMHGVRQIEVLKGGASSTYGFDAVAGVVNYRMDEDLRGEEVILRVAAPEAGGGDEFGATWLYGSTFAGGSGRWVSVIDGYHRAALFARDRWYSAEANHAHRAPAPFDAPGSVFNDATNTGVYPSFRVGSDPGTRYFRPLGDAGSLPELTATAPTEETAPEYYLNVNAFQTASPVTDRFNAFNSVDYDLSPSLTAFGELAFFHATSTVERNPIPYAGASGVDQPVVLSVDNPYNPYGSSFYSSNGAPNPTDGRPRLADTPQELTLLTQSVADVDAERINVRSQVVRLLGGLRGEISRDWNWETGLLYTFARTRDRSENEVRESLLHAAARRADATAYNPFGYTFKVENGAVVADAPYTNPAGVLATFVSPFEREGRTSLASCDFRAMGAVPGIRGRPISLTLGAEVRAETYSDKRSAYAGLNPAGSGLPPEDNDFVQASPTADSRADRQVGALHAESAIPLIEPEDDVFLAQDLELTLAGRYENYDDFGDEIAPRLGLHWRPSRWWQLHASLDRSYRAPNLAVLHAAPATRIFTGITDTYRRPVTGEGSMSIKASLGSNAGLQAEEARGFNVGVFAELPLLSGLTLSADYWEIHQSNVISADTLADIILNDSRLLTAYTQQQLAAGVPLDAIELGSGREHYRGDSRVTRATVTAEDRVMFSNYNLGLPTRQQVAAVGLINGVARPLENLARGFVSGLDLGAAYRLANTAAGSFVWTGNASLLLESYVIKASSPARDEQLGEEGSPRLRFTASLDWHRGAWAAGLSAYYVSALQDTAATTTEEIYEALGRPSHLKRVYDQGDFAYRYVIDSSLSFDAYVAYRFPAESGRWLRATTLRVGVVNLTDEAPPLSSASIGFSMTAHARLLSGRTWSLELSRRF